MSTEVGFALRAPWYVRERGKFGLRDARALRPEIQKYDNAQFVKQLLNDPVDSLVFDDDDFWSYPVPVAFGQGHGRERFATSRLVHTGLRKLYQPSHQRFYAMVIEVFCDTPGLPRAGSHTHFEVKFVMRRQRTTIAGGKRPVRQLARELMNTLMAEQHEGVETAEGEPDRDLRDLWWADCAERRRFEEDNADLLNELTVHTDDQAWMIGTAGGEWRTVGTPPENGRPKDSEEEFPMWRIPPRTDDCDAARTRSLWFGLIPTYAKDRDNKSRPKLDDHAIYELQCFVRVPAPHGPEQCAPKTYWSQPTRPFRLAAPYDPDGTKNHSVSITLPDLRRLAARAAQPPGPGGVQINTPPKSQLVFNPFNGIPGSGSGSIGAGGGACTFALELFFIVAMFLFLLFLPIVVFAFQLWWLLALRFCFPLPASSFGLLEAYFAADKKLADLPAMPTDGAADRPKLDAILGADLVTKLSTEPTFTDPTIGDQTLFGDLVAASDPHDAVRPTPPQTASTPNDPLCPLG